MTSATQDAGGILDVVCTRDDMPASTVSVLDIGLSDHRLLVWSTSLVRPPPVYVKSTRQPWRSFDLSVFQDDLRASDLCDARKWQDLDGDSLVELYDNTLTALLDRRFEKNANEILACLQLIASFQQIAAQERRIPIVSNHA